MPIFTWQHGLVGLVSNSGGGDNDKGFAFFFFWLIESPTEKISRGNLTHQLGGGGVATDTGKKEVKVVGTKSKIIERSNRFTTRVDRQGDV